MMRIGSGFLRICLDWNGPHIQLLIFNSSGFCEVVYVGRRRCDQLFSMFNIPYPYSNDELTNVFRASSSMWTGCIILREASRLTSESLLCLIFVAEPNVCRIHRGPNPFNLLIVFRSREHFLVVELFVFRYCRCFCTFLLFRVKAPQA
jgi:hypothetical protein